MEEYEQMNIFEAMFDKPEHLPKHVRLIEFFAGIGAQAKALEVLGADFEHWRTCEWSWQSITAYNAIHMGGAVADTSRLTYEEVLGRIAGVSNDYNQPMTEAQLRKKGEEWARTLLGRMVVNRNFCPDVSRLHAYDLGINDREFNTYVLTYSFPCFTGDQLVLTRERGYARFDSLTPGLHVLARDGKWHAITKFFDNGVKPTCVVKAQGFADVHCTPEHKFWVRRMKRVGHFSKRTFLDPEWVHANELDKSCYLGMRVIGDEKPFHTDSPAFWKLIGMYVGDGWLNNGDVRIACNEKKLETAKSLFGELGIKYTIVPNSEHCWNIRTADRDLYGFISKYIGTGSHDKRIPFEIIALPKPQLQAFFEGYLASDGCIIDDKYQFSTVNRNIAYSVCAIVNKLYHRVCNVYLIKTPDKHTILGRTVNQSDWYQLRFKKHDSKQDKAFYEDGWIWYPFQSYEEAQDEHVYDIEVEEDHSFMLHGCAVSNCQDLSLAGQNKGMEKGGGTRSGLLWEVERILNECRESDSLPQVLLMENVPQVCGGGNLKPWNDWLDALEAMGYTNYYKILNAKDFGIPQNRRRCFMVSILGQYSYSMPRTIPLKYRLKGFIMRFGVPRKYFLSDEIIETFERYTERNAEKGNGFAFKPTDGDVVANTVLTRSGSRPCDNYLAIPSATSKGYMEAKEGDGCLPTWNGARGTVQDGMIPTLMTSPDTIGVVVEDEDDEGEEG